MTWLQNTYYAIKCTAPIDNPLHPVCEAVSPGGYDDKVVVLEAALKLGWTEKDGKHRCPAHPLDEAAAPPQVRKSRSPKYAAAALEVPDGTPPS